MNNTLRQEVRVLKALQNIKYKEIAEKIGISQDSIYNWLRGNYDFGEARLQRLSAVLKEYKGEK